MNKVKNFLKRKNIVISRQRYLVDAMSTMTLGLFASLLIGLIISTIGEVMEPLPALSAVSAFLIEAGTIAKSMSGPAIGVGVAYGLGAPPLVLFASTVAGAMGNAYGNGGPASAYITAIIAAEFGKAISKETKLDIIVTPATTLIVGGIAASTIGPLVYKLMIGLGHIINISTTSLPFIMGVVVSVIMGLVLTGPMSSAALSIMMGLSGLAAGAATVGCSAQMIGFAVISFSANGVGGLVSQGLGTSKLQMPNVVKNPWIILPPMLASAITGALSTVVFKMENISEGAGMGTSGLVGQITTIKTMGFSVRSALGILLLHFILPAGLALLFDYILRRRGKVKTEDYKLPI